MNNRERIQQMSDQELAEYIEAIFLAGRLYESSRIKASDTMEDYCLWLKEEMTDD